VTKTDERTIEIATASGWPGAASQEVAMSFAELELADWRRQVAEIYAAVRATPDPKDGHELWRRERDRLFRAHPQSPLADDDPLRESGIPYSPYDESLRFVLPLVALDTEDQSLSVRDEDRTMMMRLVGRVELPEPFDAPLNVWWLEQYGGGIFLPVRDSTAGKTSYGGGRYCLDTAKGADLGGGFDNVMVDFNFLYHPSCRYSPDWLCPLAPDGNWIDVEINGGELL
jgi:uncharacterized protein